MNIVYKNPTSRLTRVFKKEEHSDDEQILTTIWKQIGTCKQVINWEM